MSAGVRVIPAEAAKVEALAGRRIAVLGYGAQGRAHALNLRDSGCDVVVAQRSGGPRHASAVADHFLPLEIRTAVEAADLLVFALADDVAPAVYESQIAPELRPGQALGFLHGFVIHYGLIRPPDNVDVLLVAPKAQGRAVRDAYVAGRGVPVLIAVQQDATGRARELALGWAAGIGAHRALLLETTFRDETETDLFGEQAVLCGGLTALIKAAFETLVAADYPAELAYFECCHEVKLLADLIHDHGISGMRERISSTARYGDLTRGPRLINEQTRAELRKMLEEIRSGAFAREFLADQRTGGRAGELAQRDRTHAVEQVGERLRRLMRGERE